MLHPALPIVRPVAHFAVLFSFFLPCLNPCWAVCPQISEPVDVWIRRYMIQARAVRMG